MNFLTKLVAIKPGKTVQDMIKNVMLGKDEGADNFVSDGDDDDGARKKVSSGIAGRVGSFGFYVSFYEHVCMHTDLIDLIV